MRQFPVGRMASLTQLRYGFDPEAGPAALIDPTKATGDVVRLEQNRQGEWRVRVTSTHGPIRRLRAVEGVLDSRRFIPGKTVMKCLGGMSPGDPAPTVILSPSAPTDVQSWRYFDRRKDGVARFRTEMCGLLYCATTGAALMVGFPAAISQAARIHAEFRPNGIDGGAIHLRCVTYPNFLTATPQQPVASEWVFWQEAEGLAGAQAVFEAFWARVEKRAFSAQHAQPPLPAPVGLTGWSDWQYYRRKITAKNVTANIAALARGRYPLQYLLIDDGFQREFGEWIETNTKFPKGLGWLSRFVRRHGFDLGLWIAPLTAGADSDLARKHPEWLVKNRTGAIRVSHSHMGAVVALDFTHPGAQRWLRDLVRRLVREFHTRWIKLDGPILRYIEHGKFYDAQATPVTMIRRALEIVRQAAGPAKADGSGVIIEGEGYYAPTFGLVDTQRVTQDIQPEWPRLKETTRDNLASVHLHRRFWINNPDAFLLRDTPSPHRGLPPGQRECVLRGAELELEITALALTGGVVMLTDNMPILKPARAALLDRFVPPYPQAAQPIDADFLKSPYAERFALAVNTAWGSWTVGACFNWEDRPRTMTWPLPQGLKNAVVVDFWRETVLPVNGGAVRVTVPAHGVRLFRVCARPTGSAARRPALVGVIRHITQGGVEIGGVAATADRLRFTLLASRGTTTVFVWTGGRKVAAVREPGGGRRMLGSVDYVAGKKIAKIRLPGGKTKGWEVVLG